MTGHSSTTSIEGSGQNFQQMPHLMHLPRSISGRMFRHAPVQVVGLVATEQIMSGISSADVKTTFFAFFGLMASSSGPLVRFLGRLDIVLRLDADPVSDGRGQGLELGRPRILMTAPAMAVLTIGAARLPSLCVTAISVALIVRTWNLSWKGKSSGRRSLLMMIVPPGLRPSVMSMASTRWGRRRRRHRACRCGSCRRWLVVDADEGDDGRAAPLDAELRVGLDPIALLGDGVGQDLGGDDGPLTAAAVETDFDHVLLLSRMGISIIITNGTEGKSWPRKSLPAVDPGDRAT